MISIPQFEENQTNIYELFASIPCTLMSNLNLCMQLSLIVPIGLPIDLESLKLSVRKLLFGNVREFYVHAK